MEPGVTKGVIIVMAKGGNERVPKRGWRRENGDVGLMTEDGDRTAEMPAVSYGVRGLQTVFVRGKG